MQYQGYQGNLASTTIFVYFWFWFFFVIFLCMICVCVRFIYNYMVRLPAPAPAPSRNPRFATAAASGQPYSTASTSAIAAAASRPLNSAASPRPTVAASASASTASGDHSALPSILRMLPDFVYSVGAQKQNLNCCVCQTDFKDGEKGRFLPRCFHCFHVECIDMWLASHSQCPVCRASIDPVAP